MHDSFQNELFRRFYARHWGKLWIAQALVLLAVGFVMAWAIWAMPAASSNADNVSSPVKQDDAPRIWTCSMHPQIRRNKPGDCPLCGMDLVPVTKSAGGVRTISISPAARKLMKIDTTPVQRRYVTAEVRMVGKVEFDETRLSHITARVSGRLDRLYVDYTGIEVK